MFHFSDIYLNNACWHFCFLLKLLKYQIQYSVDCFQVENKLNLMMFTIYARCNACQPTYVNQIRIYIAYIGNKTLIELLQLLSAKKNCVVSYLNGRHWTRFRMRKTKLSTRGFDKRSSLLAGTKKGLSNWWVERLHNLVQGGGTKSQLRKTIENHGYAIVGIL